MSPDTTFDVILACGVAGVAALAAGAIAQVATVVTQRRHTHNEPAALAPDPTVWRACHAPACGHLETRHDPSPLGYACRDCAERTDAS